jgi:hypothetical protein
VPRLIGKQSNNGWYAGLFLIAAIAITTGVLEYSGFTNVIPGFGQDDMLNNQFQPQFRNQ